MNERTTAVPFAVPMTWQEPKNHVDDWYFCCVSVTGFSAKNKYKIVYPKLNCSVRPVPLDDNVPVSEPPENVLAFLEQMEYDDSSSPAAAQALFRQSVRPRNERI